MRPDYQPRSVLTLTPSHSRTHGWFLAAVAALTFLTTFGFVTARPRGGDLWDFGSFLLSGYSASRGVNPYSGELFTTYVSEHHVSLTVPNLNPPLSVPVFQLLSKLDPPEAFRVWWALSLGLYVCCLGWLVRAGPGQKLLRVLWGLSLAGLWMTLALGQIYVPLAALVAAACCWMGRRRILAGVCVGLVAALKPNFLLWPAFLLVAGQTLEVCTALLVFAVGWMLPAALFGSAIYRGWLAAIAAYQAPQLATNASVSLWLSTFLPQQAVWIVASAAVVVCAGYLRRRRAPALFCSDLALVLAIALSPISWVGYTLLLLPVFLRRVWHPAVTVSAALLTFPGNLLWEWSTTHPDDILGPRMLYPLAIFLLIVGLLLQGMDIGTESNDTSKPIQPG